MSPACFLGRCCRCHVIDCTCVYIFVGRRDKAYATFHQKIRDFAQIRVGFLLDLSDRQQPTQAANTTQKSDVL